MESSEWQKMVEGRYHRPGAPELRKARNAARRWMARYNSNRPLSHTTRVQMLRDMLGSCGERVYMEPRVTVDYGCNIHVGENFYCNFDCLFLDSAPIRIGNRVMLAPGVHIYTATHPVEAEARNSGYELALPVTIGDDVWIGGRAVICPGVTIGNRVVVAAGAVVVKDVPDDALVGGNPARVIRIIDQSRRPEGLPEA